MINFDDHTIDLHCPRCHFANPVTLKQVRLRDVIICRGCKANIQLQDHMKTTQTAIRSLKRAMAELEHQLKKLGTIKIRI